MNKPDVDDNPYHLSIDYSSVAIHFKNDTTVKKRLKTVHKTNCTDRSLHEFRFEVPKEKYTIFPITPNVNKTNKELFDDASNRLQKSRHIVRVNPVYTVNGKMIIATDRVIVCFKHDFSGDKRHELRGYEYRRLNELDHNIYVLFLNETEDAIQVTNQFKQKTSIKNAEPDFITIGNHLPSKKSHLTTESNDDYVPKMIHAEDAWHLQAGNPNIRIAILDEGVDIRHENLQRAIVGTYDAVDDDNDQQPKPWNAHGTACAGLAAAVPTKENSIKGVGSGCSILGIRIAYTNPENQTWITRNSWIVNAINWAWNVGHADVLSNSWGGGAYSEIISDAFENARKYGRLGKGCVIIASAGNDAGAVAFPGNLPNLFTVSASNQFDEFKTKTSQDGETWWGSNFGPEVDLAAPGVNTWTTDLIDSEGYDPGNYTRFNGTSASAPIVAGAAGLILSRNPALTYQQVQDILRQSAEKVGLNKYDVNGRNNEFGFGRLNVLDAIKMTAKLDQQRKGDRIMKLGEGIDIISQEDKETAVYVDVNPLAQTVDYSTLSEEQLKSKLIKISDSPGSYQIRAFESLDELKRMVSSSLGLKAKLPQLGLSLDVSASRTNRVDANFIYYLVEMRSGYYTYELASVPNLSVYAKKSLELITPEIEQVEKRLDAQTSTVNKVTLDLSTASEAQTTAAAKAKVAKDTYDLAVNEDKITQDAYKDIPADRRTETIIKLLKDSQISVAKTAQQNENAIATLAAANDKVKELKAKLATETDTANDLKALLTTLKNQAANNVNDEKIETFYKRFGTHFVKKALYGRQFIALITIDRHEIAEDRTLKIAAGISAEQFSVEGSLQRELNKLAKKVVVKIDIACDGIKTTAMRNPTTMDELQDAILKFASSENHTESPSLIDFKLDSYSDVLYAAGINPQRVQRLYKRLDTVKDVHENMLELRTTAIRLYSARYFQEYPTGGAQSNALIAGQKLKLEHDPHNRRLQYLFKQLHDIILFLNKNVKLLQNNAFSGIDHIIGATPADNANYEAPNVDHLVAINQQLKEIKEELEQRGGYKLVCVASAPINKSNKFPKSSCSFSVPPKATRLHVSAFKGAAEQQNAEIAVGAKVDGRPGDIVPKTPDQSHSLGWLDATDNFKISLFQHRPGKIVKMKNSEVFCANANQQSIPLTSEIVDGGNTFYLDKGKTTTTGAAFDTTVRVYAAISDGKLNLSEVDQERKNVVTRAIEQKTLPDATNEFNSQKSCSIM